MLQLVQSQARRGVVVALVAGLAAVLAVAAAPPVTAAITPGLDDAIVKVPSSVIGSLDDATPAQRKYAIARTSKGILKDWKIPVSTAKAATKASAPFMLAGAYLTSVEAGSYALKLGGVNPNNVGLENLWDYVKPKDAVEPDYEMNSDVMDFVEGNGWAGYRRPVLDIAWNETSGQQRFGRAVYEWWPEYDAKARKMYSTISENASYPSNLNGLSYGWAGSYFNRATAKRVSNGADYVLGESVGSRPGYFGVSTMDVYQGIYEMDRYEVWIRTTAGVSPTNAQGADHYVWYPKGHPQRPAEADGNPYRNWKSSWSCSSGSGGTAQSDVFFESDAEWPEFPAAQCAQGQLQTYDVYQQTAGGLVADVLVYRWTRGAGDVFDWADNNPQCHDGSCQLILSRIDAETDARISCFTSPSLCTNWLVDPARGDKYECTYGGKVVALIECQVYGPTFNVATGVNIKDETGDETDVRTVGILGDPKTGKPVPTTTTPTVPDPGTETPPRDNSCPPPFTWTSLINPWWYYKGMTCALSDAFIPTQTQVQTHVGKVQTVWGGTAPAKWAAAVGGTFDGLAVQESGCLGPRIYWSYIDLELYPFNACDAPMSTWASWTKTFASAVIVFSGGFACFRAIGSGIGWKPSAGGDS